MIDLQVRNHLVSLNKDAVSQKLWIQGAHDVSYPSQNTFFAVCSVALSCQSEILCIFYFCNLAHYKRSERIPSFSQAALTDLVNSLIVQLAFLIPERYKTSLDLSSVRFGRLRQDVLSLDDALNLLRDLHSLVPAYLHCVVSGLQDLEDRDDVQHARDLLCVLDALVDMHRNDAGAPSKRSRRNSQKGT